MNTEQNNIPKLRFPEFIVVWDNITLGDIGKVSMCKRVMKDQTTEKGEIPFFKIGTFGKRPDAFIELSLYQEFKNKFAYPKKGEILIAASGATYGKTVVFDGNDAYFQDSNIVWIANDETLVYNQFLYHCFQRIKWAIEESTIPRLYNNVIRSAKLKIPTLPEQQKIAQFLSSVDTKIEQLSKKKQLLEQYKKGVMQQIFSQQLRFKDENGNDFPDWEVKKLGEVAIKFSSNVSANTIEENNGKYKIYGAAGLLKYVDFYREKVEYISIVKDGAGVGRILLCDSYSSVLGTLDIIKPKINANLYFIYSLLSRINFAKYSIGSTIPHIYFKDYSKEIVQLPCLEEQTQIANFLSAIDEKIDFVNTQINKTQAFKKGLLQQMFV